MRESRKFHFRKIGIISIFIFNAKVLSLAITIFITTLLILCLQSYVVYILMFELVTDCIFYCFLIGSLFDEHMSCQCIFCSGKRPDMDMVNIFDANYF